MINSAKHFLLALPVAALLFVLVLPNQNVVHADSTNLLTNGSFESGTSPWTLQVTSPAAGSVTTTTSSPEDGTRSAQLTITTSSANWWYDQFRQDTVSLVAGKIYTISFWAKASSSRTIRYALQQINTPYTSYVDQSASVTTSWQHFTYTYTATATDNAVFIGFNVAQNTGTVYLDNVELTASMAAPTGYTTLAFDDNFPGTTLDSSKWIPQIADQFGIWNNNGNLSLPLSAIGNAGGYDAEYGNPTEVNVSKGVALTARTDSSQTGYTWKAGYLSTHGKYSFNHGFVQIRAKVPDSSTGLWAGFWFLEGGAEVDLNETGFTGHGTVNQVLSSNVHTAGNSQQFYDTGTDLSAGYHIYGMKYISGTSITTYLDGVQIAQYTSNIPTGYMTINMTMSVAQNASGWHTLVSGSTPSPSTMNVSEVQVWQ